MRRHGFLRSVRIAGLLYLPVIALPLRADPPSRVGRVSFLQGSVSFRPGSVDDWTDATLNYPLTSGDHLWTDDRSRAEIQAGPEVVRMAPYTALSLLDLDDHTLQLRMTEGSIDLRVREFDAQDQVEIDLPNGSVSLLEPGRYRIDVDSSGSDTRVTVREGRAEVTAAGSIYTLEDGQSSVVLGSDTPAFDLAPPPAEDDWERWADERDHRQEAAESARDLPQDMIGCDDLDGYGQWNSDAEYGHVWFPTVATGWAPYRFGHWAWVDPWGWTWIDAAPWGFAPFHYGRWAWIGGRWGWVPGRIVRHPVYAPALVAFVDVGGPGWSASVGVGGGPVAWFPLGPREPFVPAYQVSQDYARRVNVTSVNITNVNVTNVNVTQVRYVNREVPGAVTVVDRRTFAEARPVSRELRTVSRDQIGSARVLGAAPPVAPERVSVLAREGRATARPPARIEARPVMARRAPPPPPVPFEARQRLMEATPGRPLSWSETATLHPNRPAAPPVRVVPAPTRAVSPRPNPRPVTAPTRRPAPDDNRPRAADAPPDRRSPPEERRAAPVTPAERPPHADQPAPPAREESLKDLQDRQAREREALARQHQAELDRPPAGASARAIRDRHQKEDQEMERRQAEERQLAGGKGQTGRESRNTAPPRRPARPQ